MPQESLEVFIERLVADIVLFNEGIVPEGLPARMEFLLTEMVRCVLDELRQVPSDMMKHDTDRSNQRNYCDGDASSAFRDSYPKTDGSINPGKKIEQRFSDSGH